LNLILGNLIKRLDDKESDFLTALQSEQLKEEQEKKRVEGEQLDAFKKSFPLPLLQFCGWCGIVLSVGRKVRLT